MITYYSSITTPKKYSNLINTEIGEDYEYDYYISPDLALYIGDNSLQEQLSNLMFHLEDEAASVRREHRQSTVYFVFEKSYSRKHEYEVSTCTAFYKRSFEENKPSFNDEYNLSHIERYYYDRDEYGNRACDRKGNYIKTFRGYSFSPIHRFILPNIENGYFVDDDYFVLVNHEGDIYTLKEFRAFQATNTQVFLV